MPEEILIPDLATLETFAASFANTLQARPDGATLLCLEGDLGAGKTTFTQALARALGVTDGVLSPTFVIAKRHPINWNGLTNLIHVDAYRLEGGAALRPLRFDEWCAE